MKNMIKKLIIVLEILLIIVFMTSCQNMRIQELRKNGIEALDNGNYEEAYEYLHEALIAGNGQVSKIQYDILMYYAECCYRLKDYDKVDKIYESLYKIDKNNKTYQYLNNNIRTEIMKIKFKIALDKDEIEEATEIYNTLSSLGASYDKSVRYNHAVLYEKRGEWRDALNEFNMYLMQYPDDENALHEKEFIETILNTSKSGS